MTLDIQILSLLFSFLFGLFFSLFLKLNEKILYNKLIIIKYLGSILIILVSVLGYFIILRIINNSIFHPYLLIMITVGFITENKMYSKINSIVKRHKK